MPANQDQGCYQQAASVRFSDANSVPKKLHGSVFDAKFAPHKCTDRPRYFYPAVCQLSQVRYAVQPAPMATFSLVAAVNHNPKGHDCLKEH
jgi:hypothetical protein